MSAILMGRNRFSSINPEDIISFRNRHNLSSIKFSPVSEVEENESDEDELSDIAEADEEKAIGGDGELRRRRSTKMRPGKPKKSTFVKKLSRKWDVWNERLGLRHVIPIFLLVIYSMVGALIFWAVERHADEEEYFERATKVNNTRNETAGKIISLLANGTLNQENLLQVLAQGDVANGLYKQTMRWDMWGALFYVGTIYTTIGYGNIYTRTYMGYAITIIYAFIGVPLVLAILSDIGQLLCKVITKGWAHLMKQVPQSMKKQPSPEDMGMSQSGVLPVSLCLTITFSWLFFCSALFCLWETDWTYFKAFYFFFISLSTIGLGDVVPDHPKWMIANFWLVLIGLCFVSMTLGVVQEHITLFLYRMMMQLQRECEDMLANGEDVEKSELMQKIWDKQPWYMKKLMPLLVNKAQNRDLDDFAGATITDTAVKLGIIPEPPGYEPINLLPTIVQEEPRLVPPSAAIVSAPLAMISEAKMKPKVQVHQPMVQVGGPASSPLSEPLLMAGAGNDVFSAGKVVVKKPSGKLKPVPRKDSQQERLAKALRTRIASTQTTDFLEKGTSAVMVQTDLLGNDITIKHETLSNLSMASWYEEDETSSFSLPQLERLNAEELQAVPGIAKTLATLKRKMSVPLMGKLCHDVGIQTDDTPETVSVTSSYSSASSEDFVSALETRSFAPPSVSISQRSKFVQTLSQIGMVNVEVQTQEVHSNAEWSDTRPDLLPRNMLTRPFLEKEVQTFLTDEPFGRSVETQTERQLRMSIAQRGSLSEMDTAQDRSGEGPTKVRIKADVTTGDDYVVNEDQIVAKDVPVQAKVGAWQYSAWIETKNYRDRMNSLFDLEEEAEKEGTDEEMDDAGMMEDEENNDTEAIDLHAFTESEASEGIMLPAITARYDDEEVSSKRRLRRLSSRISAKDAVITAAIATQTEEFICRRQSFPKDVFTDKIQDNKVIFPREHEKKRSHSIFTWITHRNKPQKIQKMETPRELHVACDDVSVQTDWSEYLRDIMLQTDESYLLKAKKFEALRLHRAGSLAVSVAPELKEKLKSKAQAAKAKAAVDSSAAGGTASGAASDKKQQKKITPPKQQ